MAQHIGLIKKRGQKQSHDSKKNLPRKKAVPTNKALYSRVKAETKESLTYILQLMPMPIWSGHTRNVVESIGLRNGGKPSGGLTKWFKKEKWVDISAPKRVVALRNVVAVKAKGSKRGYP